MRFPRSFAALGLAAIFVVAACGSSSSSPSASGSARASGGSGTPRPTTAGATPSVTDSEAPERTPIASVSPEELLFAEKLLFCTDLPRPPMAFYDDEGNPIGFDVDIAREIAGRLGLTAIAVNSLASSIIDAMTVGKCDVVISSLAITAEQKEVANFVTYFQAGHSLVVGKDNPENIHTQEDLCGKSIAAETGKAQADYLAGTGSYEGKGLSAACEAAGLDPIDLRTFGRDDDALLALQSGQVDGFFTNSPVAGYYVVQHPDSFDLSGLTLGVAKAGIAVPKDRPDLEAQVRRAVSAIVRDGTYLSLIEQWGLQEGSVFQ